MKRPAAMRVIERLSGRRTECDVEEELRFHMEMLDREHLQRGMTPDDARAASLRRFGELERIRSECVSIRRRSNPIKRMLRSILILIFIAGVLLRVSGPGRQFLQLADLSIAVSIFGWLFLYVRTQNPRSLFLKRENF